MMSARGLITLAVSLGALAFVAWMMAVHPNHPGLYGPAPAMKLAAAHSRPAGRARG